MYVYSFDPGMTTGLAIFKEYPHHHQQCFILQTTCEFDGWSIVANGNILLSPEDTVIIEAVKHLHPHMRIEPMLVRGALEFWCAEHGVTPVLQPPNLLAAARVWYKDLPDKLGPHERDAIHHALMYFGTCQPQRKVEYFGRQLKLHVRGGMMQ